MTLTMDKNKSSDVTTEVDRQGNVQKGDSFLYPRRGGDATESETRCDALSVATASSR